MPLPIDLPFGTALELLDPLERSPFLTGASPVTEHERVLAMLRAGVASDDGARARVVAEARRLGLRGDGEAVLREVARLVADGRWGLGGGRDVGPPVLPDPGADFDVFEPDDVEAWSVFALDWSVP